MLLPKRVKYRKQFRGRMKGKAHRGNTVSHGEFGLVALEPAWITNRQIEAARIAMKPAETRMGSGKGSPEYWVCVVKPGRVLFEMDGVSKEVAMEAMRLAGHKLPIRTKFVTREESLKAAEGGEVNEG